MRECGAVVGLADDVSIEDLAIGDEVFLGRDLNVVMSKSPSPLIRTGETATFERALDDGRIVLKHRDDEWWLRHGQSRRRHSPLR